MRSNPPRCGPLRVVFSHRKATRLNGRRFHLPAPLPAMNPTLASPSPAAPAETPPTKKYRVTVTLMPDVLGRMPPIYVNLLLGVNRHPDATAVLSNFAFVGRPLAKHWFNPGATGDFASTIRLQCRAGAPAPQAIGVVAPTLQRFWFDLALTAAGAPADRFTLRLLDQRAEWFPTSAPDEAGVLARVTWTPDGQSTGTGYRGNGMIAGHSDLGFGATVTPL